MAGEREVRIKFTGDSAVLKGAAGDVRKIFQNLIDDENDARGAGEKLADAQKQVAANMRKSMADISAAADVLADSLGPEMVRALEATGRSVEDEVQRYRKLGLTLDDVVRDSDLLAQGMRDLDDAARMGTGAVGDGMRKVATTTDQTRSVVANFTGNAMQELPGVAGAMGPLNMAMGQFAEYAAEGNINFKNLLASGAALGAVSLLLSEIADNSKRAAEANTWRTENINAWVESLRAGEDAADALVQRLEDAGEVQVKFAGVLQGVLGGDLADDMARAGVTLDQFAAAATGGQEGLDNLSRAMERAGVSAADQGRIMVGAATYQDLHTQALKTAAEWDKIAGGAASELNDTWDRGTGVLGQHTSATRLAALAQEELAAAYERNEQAQKSLTEARLAAIDQGFAQRAAEDGLTRSLEAYAAATDDQKTGVNEVRVAQDAAAQAAIQLGLASQTTAQQLADAAGVPLTFAAKQQILIDSLYATAVALDPASPLRAQLVGYISMLQEDIPASKATKITLDNEDASTRIGFQRDKTKDAEDAVTDLQVKLDGLPTALSIPFDAPGLSATLDVLDTLLTKLGQVRTAARNANSAVNLVIT
jgi:hypothetical protein